MSPVDRLEEGRPSRSSSGFETITESCRLEVPESVPAVRIHFAPPNRHKPSVRFTARGARFALGYDITAVVRGVRSRGGVVQSVRLAGIDAPESAQTFGTESTRHLSELISGKAVSLQCEHELSYGRIICLLAGEMSERFGHRPVDAVSVDELSAYRQSWKLAGISTQKKLERLRTFFRFCIERGWAEKNPASALKLGRIKPKLTLPVSDEDFGKLLEATARFSKKGIYGEKTGRRIKAFLLVLRYSGLRIRDCVMLKKSAVRDGRVFLYSAKTGVPVHIPLPDFVLEELAAAGNGGENFFWSGIGKPKRAVADWQRSLARLGALAAIRFHPHQLRDSFAIGLLKHGVPIEDLAALLGNSVKVAQAHCAPWVKVRQDRLEEA